MSLTEKEEHKMQRFYEEYERQQNTIRSGKCSWCGKHTEHLFEQDLCSSCFDEAVERERELGLR